MKQASAPNIFQAGQNRPNQEPSQADIQAIVSLVHQGRMAEAEPLTLRLTQRCPNHGFGWKTLGVIYRHTGRLKDSLKPMQMAAKLLPNDHEAFNNLGGTFHSLGDTQHAEACYRHAIALNPGAVDAIANLAHMLMALGREEDALPLLERKVALTPEDDYTRHLVHAMRGVQSERAPAKYVTRTFDEYAGTFESHLQNGLQYTAPAQLITLIEQSGLAPQGPWRVLDLGCGTGLVGSVIGDRARELVGVDLSPKMLAQAREKNRYQSLVCADLVPAMQAEAPGSFDIVVSADVFIYIGKLEEIVQQARRVLREGGLFAFSVENIDAAADGEAPLQAPEPEYQLKRSGRYGQSVAYLNRLAEAQNFKAVVISDSVLRLDGDGPVHGKLVVWQA